MKPTVLVFLLAVLSFSAASAGAQDVEAPSDFQRSIDAPAATMGEEDEADAAAAQASAIEAGGVTPGLDAGGRQRVEEIVVRARKRDEFLEDTPVAVTVLGETALRQSGITRIDQIQDLVPNMTFAQGLAGQAPQIRIRGVGTTTVEPAFDPGVGVYVDGVFLARAIGQLLDTVDVQQVEVLRGPQGTLFGKNTVGGAVSVTTVKPKPELEGFVFLRPGNYGSIITRAMLNLPVYEDKVLTRFALSSKNSRGYVYNQYRDEYMSALGSIDFLGSVRLALIDDLNIDVSGQYANSHNNARGGECVFSAPGALEGLVADFKPECEQVSGPFVTNEAVAQINAVTSSGVWGVLEWTPGGLSLIDDVSVKSISSWRQQTSGQRFDLDGSSFPAIQLSNIGGGALFDADPSDQEQIQQELQFNGSAWDGRINFVTGFFAYWENVTAPMIVRAETDAFVTATANRITTDNFTWALFGQGTVDVTDWLSLTAGLRYTSDRKSFTQEAYDPRTPGVPPSTGDDSGTYTSWTPTATLALLTPDEWLDGTSIDHLMGYFTYSRGFKGGGFNAVLQSQVGALNPVPFDPETLDNFEVGFKTIALDNVVTLNLALFRGKYDDIQVSQFLTSFDDEGNVVSQRVTQNAAKATIQGVEAEVWTQPIDGLILTGTLGYLDTRYDSYPDSESQMTAMPIDRSGETFDQSPKIQTFVSAQYSFAVDVDDDSPLNGWLTPRLEWAYRDRFHTVAPEVPQGWQAGYNLLNARLSYDFFDDRAQVAVWAKNLLGEAYFNQTFAYVTTFGGVSRFYEPPLTFGGELSYSF